MIGRLDHVGHAVPDLDEGIALWRGAFGAEVGEAIELPAHGVRVAFARLGGAEVELLAPLGDGGPLAGFLARSPSGGLHHVCWEVGDLAGARDRLAAAGLRPLGEPRVGAHGRPVLFFHPREALGALVEIMGPR